MTLRSLKALLFAAIFLAGNLGLPATDILLGHATNPEYESRVHLEAPGGCGHHAEHCVLSRLLSEVSGEAPAAVLVTGIPVTSSSPLRLAVLQAAAQHPPTGFHSRAPPTPLS